MIIRNWIYKNECIHSHSARRTTSDLESERSILWVKERSGDGCVKDTGCIFKRTPKEMDPGKLTEDTRITQYSAILLFKPLSFKKSHLGNVKARKDSFTHLWNSKNYFS